MWNWFCNFNIETVVVLTDIPIKNMPQHRLKRFFIIHTTGYLWLKKISCNFKNIWDISLQILHRPHWLWHKKIAIFSHTSPVLTQLLTVKTITMKTKRHFTINWKFRTMITLTINPITLKMMTNKLKIKTEV